MPVQNLAGSKYTDRKSNIGRIASTLIEAYNHRNLALRSRVLFDRSKLR